VLRRQLDAALDDFVDGDTLIVTNLDRLARSVADLCGIVKNLEARDAFLCILR
jgi:DNA invertase Pin-like site-specific DNA recombinase